MCYSEAVIFFGIFVRSIDLHSAGQAWKELKPVFLAIDLIVSRRIIGKLSCAGSSKLPDVPLEVWELVKHELAGARVVCARDALYKETCCEHCAREGRQPHDLDQLRDCDLCMDGFYAEGGFRETFADGSAVGPPSSVFPRTNDADTFTGAGYAKLSTRLRPLQT
jgi:hypothetical protein